MKTSRFLSSSAAICAGFFFLIASGLASSEAPKPASSEPPLPDGATVGLLMDHLRQGVARPELYNHYRRDLLRVKIDDRYHVRLRDGQLADVEQARNTSAEKALSLLDVQSVLAGSGSNLSEIAPPLAMKDPQFAETCRQLIQAGCVWHLGHGLSENQMDAYKTQGERLTGKKLPDMNHYFILELPDHLEAAQVYLTLTGLAPVGHLEFMDLPTLLPDGNTNCVPDFSDYANRFTLPASSYQDYLDPAPRGFDARFAWDNAGYNGAGVTICDMEYQVNGNHADLTGMVIGSPPATGPPFTNDHGTAVCTIAAGRDNGFGVKGIAYGAGLQFSSTWRGSFFGTDYVHGLTNAMDLTNTGDIIILETQTVGPNRPANPPEGDQSGLVSIEWLRSSYDAVVTAIANGRIICGAAGNGGENFDGPAYSSNVPGWPNGQGPFQLARDSGSMIVGASIVIPPSPASFTNYGATVDVHGWGTGLTSGGYADPAILNYGTNLCYYNSFGGTSGASPCVAGCAAVLQEAYRDIEGRSATPAEMKELLRSTGTPQSGTNNIGPRPNLRAALESLGANTGANTDPVAPTLNPPSGNFNSNVVAIFGYGDGTQNSSNTEIRYTTDLSEPTRNSMRIIPEVSPGLVISQSTIIKTTIFQLDASTNTWFQSPTEIRSYILASVAGGGKCATPTFNTSGPSENAPFNLVISTATSGATIRYVFNGNISWLTDTPLGNTYTGPVGLPVGSYGLAAIAEKPGLEDSDPTPILELDIIENAGVGGGGLIQLTPPTIFPTSSGPYPGSVSVSLSSTLSPAISPEIRYTTNGTDPSASSLLYIEPIEITSSSLVKARTFASGYAPSVVVSRTFNIVQAPNTPSIQPNGGEFVNSANVSLSTSTPGAQIRYTTNGGEPNATSPLYTGAFTLGHGSHTVKAIAFFGSIGSSVRTAQFTVFDPSTVVQRPVIRPFNGNQTLIFTLDMETETEGAEIRYTVDTLGTVTQSDLLYNPNNPQQFGGNPDTLITRIIRARAFKNGVGSSQVQMSYNIFWPFDQQGNRLEVADITIEPEPGVYHNRISNLRFLSDTSSVQFKYTTNGADPLETSNPSTVGSSTGAFQSSVSFNRSLSSTATVRVAGTRLGFFESDITEAEYIFKCAPPEVTPGSGTFVDSVEISMSDDTQFADIHYTTDGSTPDENSPEYTDPITLGIGVHTINAIAVLNNFEDSEVVTMQYNVSPDPVAPTITTQPQSQEAAIGSTVTLSVEATGVPDVSYAWTLDGIPMAIFGSEVYIPSVNTGSFGNYQVTVSNSAGSVTSNVAVLSESNELSPIQQWRQTFFGTTANTGDAADSADPDCDGNSNREEFEAGTDPTNPNSSFRISRSSVSGNQITLEWPSVAGKDYQITGSATLSGWSPIAGATNIPGTGGDLSRVLNISGLSGTHHFRVEVVP